jgi:hypothetical protein
MPTGASSIVQNELRHLNANVWLMEICSVRLPTSGE